MWGLKDEIDKLKHVLHKKTSVQEVEDLVNENNDLRIELQKLIGRPLEEHDLEHPESFQDALVLTEDLIKRRKLDLASEEMKEKLARDNRCLICTLKPPCKHSNIDALALIPKEVTSNRELALPSSNTPTFLTGGEAEGPKKFRIRSCRGRGEIMDKRKSEDNDEKMIKEAQKRLNILSKIEAFREEKLRKEIEKMENETRLERELEEKQRKDDEKRKKYYESQKEKIAEFLEKKRKSKDNKNYKSARPQSQRIRKRPISNIKIRDYENRKFMITEILKQQSRVIKSLNKIPLGESGKEMADSVDLLYVNN